MFLASIVYVLGRADVNDAIFRAGQTYDLLGLYVVFRCWVRDLAGLRVAEAALRQAQAGLASAVVMLNYSEVRAPIDGWVIDRRAEVGNMTAPGAALYTIGASAVPDASG